MKKLIITGNVGKDAESRADQNGNIFVTFSVGVSVGTKQNPKTDWVEVSCNGKLADLAKIYIKKGMKVLIEGYPTATAYINKENKPVASLRLYANNLEFLSSKQEDGNKVEDVGMPMFNLSDINPVASNESHELKVDDIPF
ncbi:MAG TPA: single-stranded DNA-binding protein [Burkholderiales bacterium]|nr:single-stranded DNA-binding protein [Burkholderiales bacterium]